MIRSQRSGINHQGGIGINVFTEDERQAIHWGTVEVLETAGLWVEDDEALDLFADGGCKVDRSTRKVRIPQHVLEECISWAPSTVTLCGRDARQGPRHGGPARRLHQLRRGRQGRRPLGRQAAPDHQEGRR